MDIENIPTLGEWLETLPTWKAVLFVWWQEHIGLSSAVVLFGYTRARRDPLLPRIKRDLSPGR